MGPGLGVPLRLRVRVRVLRVLRCLWFPSLTREDGLGLLEVPSRLGVLALGVVRHGLSRRAVGYGVTRPACLAGEPGAPEVCGVRFTRTGGARAPPPDVPPRASLRAPPHRASNPRISSATIPGSSSAMKCPHVTVRWRRSGAQARHSAAAS